MSTYVFITRRPCRANGSMLCVNGPFKIRMGCIKSTTNITKSDLDFSIISMGLLGTIYNKPKSVRTNVGKLTLHQRVTHLFGVNGNKCWVCNRTQRNSQRSQSAGAETPSRTCYTAVRRNKEKMPACEKKYRARGVWFAYSQSPRRQRLTRFPAAPSLQPTPIRMGASCTCQHLRSAQTHREQVW